MVTGASAEVAASPGQGDLSLDAESGSHMRPRRGMAPSNPPGSGIHIQARGLQAPRPHAASLLPPAPLPPSSLLDAPLLKSCLVSAASADHRWAAHAAVYFLSLLEAGSPGRSCGRGRGWGRRGRSPRLADAASPCPHGPCAQGGRWRRSS